MPTAAQRAIMGAAAGANAFFSARIEAISRRQQMLQANREAMQKERELDLREQANRIRQRQVEVEAFKATKVDPMEALREIYAREVAAAGGDWSVLDPNAQKFMGAWVDPSRGEEDLPGSWEEAASWAASGKIDSQGRKWDENMFNQWAHMAMQKPRGTGSGDGGIGPGLPDFMDILNGLPKVTKQEVNTMEAEGVVFKDYVDIPIPPEVRFGAAEEIFSYGKRTGRMPTYAEQVRMLNEYTQSFSPGAVLPAPVDEAPQDTVTTQAGATTPAAAPSGGPEGAPQTAQPVETTMTVTGHLSDERRQALMDKLERMLQMIEGMNSAGSTNEP